MSMPGAAVTLDEVLYPAVDSYETGQLPVDDVHVLSWERSGNPDGVPAVVLHGGPGEGRNPVQRRSLDPEFYQTILYDQRGCGASTPRAELTNNTTPHLVADLEKLRVHLGVERWLVCGEAWGSFLALSYAQAHPGRCLGLRLNGISLGRRREAQWRYEESARRMFPAAWQALRDFLPAGEREDLLLAYYHRLTNLDPGVHLPAAVALRGFTARTGPCLRDAEQIRQLVTPPEKALAAARLSLHYAFNGSFMAPGSVLGAVDSIRHLPGVIVQPRFDVIVPVDGAFELAAAWPEARFVVVDEVGQARNDSLERHRALIGASDWLRGKVAARSLCCYRA